ncbi:MAG: hypothetical protein ACFCD0_24200 [Gemmataceae bacterium]
MVSGSGDIDIVANTGENSLFDLPGVNINSSFVNSNDGDIIIEGRGGSGDGGNNHGVQLQQGADTVSVRATGENSITDIQGGDGADTISIGSTDDDTSTLDGILGDIGVDGGAGGANRLLINDGGDTAHNDVQVFKDRIAGPAGPNNNVTISYEAIDGSFTNGDTNDGILVTTSLNEFNDV